MHIDYNKPHQPVEMARQQRRLIVKLNVKHSSKSTLKIKLSPRKAQTSTSTSSEAAQTKLNHVATTSKNAPHDIDLEDRPVTATVTRIFSPSALLQLPKEVRLRIYRYALFPKGTEQAPRPYFSPLTTWRVKPPSLLQTCYEMRGDAIGVYYDEFTVSTTSVEAAVPWLKSLDEAAVESMGRISVRWDHGDVKRMTDWQQANQRVADFQAEGLRVRRSAVVVVY